MKGRNSKVFLQIAKFLLILLFTYTGISKLSGHDQFAAQLSLQPQISAVALLLSWLLPIAELLTVSFLLFERTQLIGLLSATFLMTVFTLYVGAMLLFKTSLPCSCGGVLAEMTWKQHLIFNFFFTCLSWTALIYYLKQAIQDISPNKKEVSRKPLTE